MYALCLLPDILYQVTKAAIEEKLNCTSSRLAECQATLQHKDEESTTLRKSLERSVTGSSTQPLVVLREWVGALILESQPLVLDEEVRQKSCHQKAQGQKLAQKKQLSSCHSSQEARCLPSGAALYLQQGTH